MFVSRIRVLTVVMIGVCIPFLSPAQDPDKRPNVILCMADDLGWGDPGYNGNKVIRTPNLDDMAASGIRFDRFYSGSSVCSPTRGSCLTGRNPYRYGVYTANKGHLRDEEISLAEIFKNKGYTTGHFGKWHLGTLSPEYSGKGANRDPSANYMTPGMSGFDEWFSTEYAVATYDPYLPENSHGKNDPRNLYWENGVNITSGPEGDDSEIIMDRALPFIKGAVKEQRPFFVVVWFHAPHAPVVGNPEIMERDYSDYPENEQHYYSVVTSLDEQVGRLRAALKELGVAENTMLCFTSDNGPEGNPSKRDRFQGTAGKFRGRKRSLYEGGVRVPGIIEFPQRYGEHRSIDVPVVTSDYFLTCCDLLGIEVSGYDRPYDGISLLPILSGKQSRRNKAIGFQWGTQKSFVKDRYKLVYNTTPERPNSDNGSVPVEEYELYDLLSDPSETRNIIIENAGIAEQMKKELHDWISSCENSDAGKDY